MTLDIVVTDHGLLVQPWAPGLEPHLTLERSVVGREPVVTKSGRLKTTERRSKLLEPMWKMTADGSAGIVPPAMLKYVLGILPSIGCTARVHDVSTPCSPPDWSRMSRTPRDGQMDILRTMCTERHALIKAATGLGKTVTIEEFRRINPDLRLGIVTFTGSVRDSIANRVQAADMEHSVCVIRAGMPRYEADTYVLGVQSLHHLEPDMIDALIIDEVHGAGSEVAFDKLLRFAHLRTYGLSATTEGRHDKADLVPIVLCGPVLVDLDYAFSVDAGANVPIDVYIYQAQGPDHLAKMGTHLQEKLGIWRNSRRNALIACLAERLPPEEQSIVLCRSTEHVLRLRRMLPGYTCVFKRPPPERAAELEGMGLLEPGWEGHPSILTDADAARTRFERNDLRRVICTPIWREGVDFPHLRWLIRADGTANKIFNIQSGGRLARRTEGKTGAAIIDFMDKFSGLEGKSHARIGHYRKEGWNVHHIG